MLPLDRSQKEFLEQATAQFEVDLLGSPAVGYLEGRGISPELSARYRLGYVGSTRDGLERYRGRIAVPSICARGVVSMRFRSLDPDADVKMLGMPKPWPTRLFNVRAVQEADDVIAITEGEFDAISLEAMGLPAVGAPGANSWESSDYRHHGRLFSGFRKVLIFGDGDDAGRDFAKKVYESMSVDVEAIIIPMPKGEDPNSLFVRDRGKLQAMITEYSR